MNEQDKSRLSQLDPSGNYGTIQSALMDPSINETSFGEVCYYLLKQALSERAYFEQDNMKLINVLKSNDLYTSEILFGDV